MYLLKVTLVFAYVILITAKTYSDAGLEHTEGSTDDDTDLEADNDDGSSGSSAVVEGSAETSSIFRATTLEIEDEDFVIDEKTPVGQLLATTVAPRPAIPEECDECKPGTKENGKKGDHGVCEQALRDIQNVSFLLREINERGMESMKGEKGDKGAQGERGLPGRVLYKGDRGAKGDRGVKGERGPLGPTGSDGRPGQKGDRGIQGDVGIQGPPGSFTIGLPGQKGEKGDCLEREVQGLPGPKGATGNGLLFFRTMEELQKMVKFTSPGAIAYVEERGRFYGRVPKGWALFVMQLGDSVYKPRKPISERQPTRRARYDARRRERIRGSYRVNQDVSNDRPASLNQTHFQEPSRLRLVALNDPWSGNMHGIDHINYQCQKEAMNEGINSIFRAFLSVRGVHLKSLVQNQKDTIVNLHNKTLFESWSGVFLTSTNIFQSSSVLVDNTSSALYSFNGKNVIMDPNWDLNLIWHGAHIRGKFSHRNCKNWTTNDTSSVGIASDFLYKYMLHQQDEKCDSMLIVLCIELPPHFVQKCFDQRNKDIAENTTDGYSKLSESSNHLSFDEYNHCLNSYGDF